MPNSTALHPRDALLALRRSSFCYSGAVDAVTPEAVAVHTSGDLADFHARHHTYHSVSKDRTVYSSRLDRWYLPSTSLHRVLGPFVVVPAGATDHDSVLIRYCDRPPDPRRARTKRRRVLRFPLPAYAKQAITEHVELAVQSFSATVADAPPAVTARAWDRFKAELRRDCLRIRSTERRRLRASYRQRFGEALRALALDKARSTQQASASISRGLGAVDELIPSMERLSLDPAARRRCLRRQVQDLQRGRLAALKRRKFAVYAGTGARAERAFFRRISTKFRPRAVTTLTADDLASAWRPILTAAEPPEASIEEFFTRLPPLRIQHPDDWLSAPFSASEVLRAIRACACGRSGGPDGLPNDFYRLFGPTLAELLAPLFTVWFREARLPQSFGAAIIHCVPKSSAPATGLDFRPLSLTNSDYKIFARVIATRVRARLSTMVRPTQFGFVPHRDVHDAVDIFHAAQQAVRSVAVPHSATAVLLDFAKAYDTLSRRFLLRALERYGFPPATRAVIGQMHAGTSVSFQWGGTLSQRVGVRTGIRQGCPLAPLLFVLAINTLLETLEYDGRLPGISLGAHRITGVGYADDTAVYLTHPSEETTLIEILTSFGSASGLRVNLTKSTVIALSPEGPSSAIEAMTIPVQRRHSTTRYLGAQVGSQPDSSAIWTMAEQQINARLHLAQLKTLDTLQRIRVCRAVVFPKVLFVARHTWPSRAVVDRLCRAVRNFVWHGRFSPTATAGRAWMSAEVAELSLQDGGLALPDLRQHLSRLGSRTVSRWLRHVSPISRAAGALLMNAAAAVLPLTPSRVPVARRHSATIVAAGCRAFELAASQIRTPHEVQLLQPLISRAGSGRLSAKDWSGGWLHCDYGSHREQLHALRKYQEEVHGRFLSANLLRARIRDTGLLLTTRRSGHPRLLAGLASPTDTVRDLVEVRWLRRDLVGFRCRTRPFPLPPHVAMRFRAFCDLLVANYPGLLLPMDPPNILPVVTPDPQVWKVLQEPEGYRLWRDTGQELHDHGVFRDRRGLLRLLRRSLQPASQLLVVRPHECFMLCPPIWDPRAVQSRTLPPSPATLSRGLAEVAGRERRWNAEEPAIAAALQRVRWIDIFRLPTATSSQRLLFHRIRGLRVQGWVASLRRRGCPHCPDLGATGGSVSHIFWHCRAAARVWQVLQLQWQRLGLWRHLSAPHTDLALAAFSLQLPATPVALAHALLGQPCGAYERVYPTVARLWQTQVLWILQFIWRWRCSFIDTVGWSLVAAERRVRTSLASTLRTAAETADDDRLALSIFSAAHSLTAGTPVFSSQFWTATQGQSNSVHYVLFFDGGSRGNPGPGGAGAVIVAVQADATSAHVVWAAAMSYASPATTNNSAEYAGLLVGLQAALARRFTPLHVVGDSRLILSQVSRHRTPRHPRLLHLYRQVRPLADILAVRTWTHHLRAHNKMADAAANMAMDRRRSMQTDNPSGRAEWRPVLPFLTTDVMHWISRQPL